MHQYHFPIELWMRIFQDVGTEEWLHLLVTCQLFYPLAQASLYKDIRVDRLPNKSDESLQNSRAILAAQTFAARPDLSGLVHSLWLYSACQDRLEHQILMDAFAFNPVLRKLGTFSSLRVFTLRSFYIDPLCYAAIRSLTRRHLECLEVSHCHIDPDLSEALLPPTLGNAMSRLTIILPVTPHGWTVLTSPGLKSLTMDISFQSPSFLHSILSDFIRSEVHKTLTELIWNWRTHTKDGYHPSLRHFMELCTQLRIMRHISDTTYVHRTIDVFSAGSMPRLTKFEGPAKYAQIFVPGRPVYSLSLKFYDDDPMDALEVLKFSNVPVTDLKIFRDHRAHLGNMDFGLLKHAPTTLQRISWDGHCHKEKLQLWLPLFACNTNLYSIRLSADSVLLQQDIVQLVAEACVSVREISFFSGESWMWRREGWEYYPKRT